LIAGANDTQCLYPGNGDEVLLLRTHPKNMHETGLNEESNEAEILRARENSNRAIARRNLLGVGDSLGEDYVGIIGDGTFVPSRAEYLKLFRDGFDRPKQSMTYLRTPDVVNVADDQTLAAERGNWTAALPSGSVAYSGTYAAMWRRTLNGWKIRSEIFVTLQG
jgi:ketosteroid isomerase-like protein